MKLKCKCMYLLVEYISNIYEHTETVSINQIKTYLSEWNEYIKITVDHFKYQNDIDIITIYINARKAYPLIVSSLDIGEN